MSIHRSLRGVNTLTGERSVLTRFERVQKMLRDGKIARDAASPYGLPKMRTRFKVVTGKRAKEVAEAAAGKAAATAATPAAKGAAAKPAAAKPAAAKPAAPAKKK